MNGVADALAEASSCKPSMMAAIGPTVGVRGTSAEPVTGPNWWESGSHEPPPHVSHALTRNIASLTNSMRGSLFMFDAPVTP